MHIAQTRLSIATAPREIKEITAEVARWTERQRISVGLLTLYIPHTSAPLLIQENASPDVRRDLDAFLPRIVPENVAPYRHNDEGPDDMPAHIKSALTQTQLSIPVTDGRFAARHLAGVPIPCVSRADPPGFRIRRAADFSEPPLRYVVVWNVAKETARRTLSHFAGEVVIGTASRLRWDQEFESPFLQRRVSCELDRMRPRLRRGRGHDGTRRPRIFHGATGFVTIHVRLGVFGTSTGNTIGYPFNVGVRPNSSDENSQPAGDFADPSTKP
jgi:secondary thiamine-phosphate synthase enzyme